MCITLLGCIITHTFTTMLAALSKQEVHLRGMGVSLV